MIRTPYIIFTWTLVLLAFGCAQHLARPEPAWRQAPAPAAEQENPAPKPFGCDARDLINFSCGE